MQKTFETIGKLSLRRHFFSFFSFGLIVCSLCFFSFFVLKKRELEELSHRMENIYETRNSTLEKRVLKKNFFSRYRACDPLYLEKHVETLGLLSREIEELYSLLNHPAFCMRESLHKRLQFLTSPRNRIVFQEENTQRSRQMKEAQVSFLHPVEMDLDDLEKTLSLIEGVVIQDPLPLGRPQLIIQKLEMKKKQKEEEKETFVIQMQLLKREFL